MTLLPGAVGRDVLSLTRRLRLEGAWKRKKLARTYDNRVIAAVKRYQKKNDMVQDGIARPALLAATQGKIIIDKSKFRLRAYRDGKLVLTFPIAIGQARYPSPTGTFVDHGEAQEPDLDPAELAVGEGPRADPARLGQPARHALDRHVGPAIGIHGTPASGSIGTAASHGCIRMHIRDVEKLFEYVDVGESVVFRA